MEISQMLWEGMGFVIVFLVGLSLGLLLERINQLKHKNLEEG